MDVVAALRTFLRVAETGSFSSAALDLSLTQPAVSRQISIAGGALQHPVAASEHQWLVTDSGRRAHDPYGPQSYRRHGGAG